MARHVKIFRYREGVPDLVLSAPMNTTRIATIEEITNHILTDIICGSTVDIEVTDSSGARFLLEISQHKIKRTQLVG